MIIKKPYAFLIKNFRIIHVILFGLLLFLTIKSASIYIFFSDYASNHYYINTANMVDTYVNIYMYLACIFSFLISLLIYYLLSIKNKEDKLYLFICLYNIILFMVFIVCSSIFKGLETTSLSVETVRLYRDVSIILVLPLIVLTFITFSRALGFNIKQFDFKKDLEEIKIDEKDAEEVEITLSNNNHKVPRFFRKIFRLTKYFVLENKFFVIVLSSIIVFIITMVIFSKIKVYNVSYITNEEFNANNVWFQVKDVYYTNTDMNNVVLTKGKYYILVNVKVSNKLGVKKVLNKDDFRLNIEDDFLLPETSLIDNFIDIGQGFSQKDLMPGSENEYLVIFEIDEKNLSKDYIMSVKNFTSTVGNSEEAYKEVLITPISLMDKKDAGVYDLPADLDFNNTVLKNSKMHISSYDIADMFKEKYNACINDNCKLSTYSVIINGTNKKNLTILKLKSTLKLDSSLYIKRYIKYPKDLLDFYGYIEYKYKGKEYTSKVKSIDVNLDKNNYIYLEVPYNVKNASESKLIILIRGKKYTINLKKSI